MKHSDKQSKEKSGEKELSISDIEIVQTDSQRSNINCLKL